MYLGGSRRRADAMQGMDRAYRNYVEANKVAWEKATEGMPKDAFADDVPDDIDRDGTVRSGPNPCTVQKHIRRFLNNG